VSFCICPAHLMLFPHNPTFVYFLLTQLVSKETNKR
jgi:hypothetical protein